MKILVTGAAGFIGYHLVEALVRDSNKCVVGIDNINDYYDTGLKYGRLQQLGITEEASSWLKEVKSTVYSNYSFIRMNLEDKDELMSLCQNEGFDTVVNLAAQAGVRHSIENPDAYIQSNIVGFANVLESCRHSGVSRLLYASSSSVYGNSKTVPFSVTQSVDNPISLYAATKKSNELMAHTYSSLYGIQTVGLRFFTVYGPWGRPDMAMFLFTDAIIGGRPIKVFNGGDLSRDFTFIDDIVEGITLILNNKDKMNLCQVFNIGNGKPIRLTAFIEQLESELGKVAQKEMLPMQQGDVNQTWADIEDLKIRFGYNPKTSVSEGIKKFVTWYKQKYR